jgi:hypothetical protein
VADGSDSFDDDETATQRRAVLAQWSAGVRILHISHNLASEAFNKWGRVTGVATAALASIVGTTIFASLATSTSIEVRIATGIASLLAAALGAAQLIWNYPELSQQHKATGAKYGVLRRNIDQVLSGGTLSAAQLKEVSALWEQTEADSPPLAERFRRRSRGFVAASDARVKPASLGRTVTGWRR